jgi:hypothetical protein
MNTHVLRRVRELFNCGIPRIDRHNRRAWVRSVRHLGDSWLLAHPVNRSNI